MFYCCGFSVVRLFDTDLVSLHIPNEAMQIGSLIDFGHTVNKTDTEQ